MATIGPVFGVEMASIMAYAPMVEAIAGAHRPPIVAAASSASRDPGSPHHFLYQAAAWLARQVDADLVEVPGGHMCYLTDPVVMAESPCDSSTERRTLRGITDPARSRPPSTPTSKVQSQSGRRSETRP